jgi:hypothetical protein
MTKITGKKRNPQDSTRRNDRASHHRDNALAARIAALDKRLTRLEELLKTKALR